MIMGIVGGIASGKSTVARLLAEAGASSVDADVVAHDLLQEPELQRKIRDRFSADVFSKDGHVDRARLASRVFANPAELEALNEIVHPPVQVEILKRITEHRRKWPGQVVPRAEAILVLDVSLLASSPLRGECDRMVFVDAKDSTRTARCRERGWSDDERARRESHQASLEEKKAMAHWSIMNSGSLEETRRQVSEILEEILESKAVGPTTRLAP